MLSVNLLLDGLNKIRIDVATNEASFAIHRGFCYASRTKIGGEYEVALKAMSSDQLLLQRDRLLSVRIDTSGTTIWALMFKQP